MPVPPGDDIFYTNFLTPLKGWLVVQDKVYYTADGGTNWMQNNNSQITPFSCSKMKFINDSTGYAIAGYTTYKTLDSGKIWEPIPRDYNFSYLGYGYKDIQVISNLQFWCAGELELLEINTNPDGTTLPVAFFNIDTTGFEVNRNVGLVNYSRTNYSYEWYVNGQLIGTTYHLSYVHDVYHPTDTIKLVVRNSLYSDSLIKYQYLEPIPQPSISYFSPATGTTGSVITIYGSYLSKTSAVNFGTFAATSFSIISDSVITAVVGDGASGSVSITTIGGNASFAGFTYVPPPPVITSVSPFSATPGLVITINGNYFNGATGVSFGGNAAMSFTIISQTQMTAVIGTAGSGNVVVTTPAGTGSISGFTILPVVTISSFSPLSGSVGTTVTITGTNFSSIPANNIVYFGGVRAPVTNTTSTQLTVKVPAGAIIQPITVEVNGQTVQSSLLFQPTFTGGETITSSSFAPVVTYPAIHDYDGYGALGDLDGDGKLDLVCGKGSVFRNTSTLGNISFGPRQDIFPMLSSPYTSLLRDMDGDGKLDMVITSIGLKIAKNISTIGNIAFENPVGFVLATGGLGVADIDGDNRPDVAMLGGNNVWIARNTSSIGTFSFENAVHYETGDQPWECIFADLDGDNKPEMIIPNYYSGNVGVYHNISVPGKIDFEPAIPIDMGGVTWRVAVSDIDGDGKTDLVVAHSRNSNNYTEFFSVVKNISSGIGDISFGPVVDFQATDPFSLQIADVNGDNKPDVITANQSNQTVSVFENTGISGNISFAPRVNFTTGGNVYPRYAPVGDMDNDGKPDIVYMNFNSNSLTIFRNGTGEHFADAGTDTVLCVGSSVMIGTPEVSGYTYTWISDPIGFASNRAMPIVTPLTTTKYYLTVTIPNGIHSTDSVIIQIQTPIANAGSDQSICKGTGVYIGSSPESGIAYNWTSIPQGFTSTEALPFVSPQSTTQYYLLVTSAEGCTSRDTVMVSIIQDTAASATIAGVTTVATGQSSLITATPINAGNNASFVWQDSTANHDWLNISIVNGPPTINYMPKQTGDKLRCIMYFDKLCIGTSSFITNVLQFIVQVATGVVNPPYNNYEIKFYPNPASSMLYIDSLKLSDKWQTLDIIDIDGKKIITNVNIANITNITLSITKLNQGVYFAILTQKNGTKSYFSFIKI